MIDHALLERLESRRKAWEQTLIPMWLVSTALIFYVWFLFFPLGQITISQWLAENMNEIPVWGRYIVGIFQLSIPLILTFATIPLYLGMDLIAKKYWFKTYYIEESMDIIKVHGAIVFVHMDYVREQLRRIRPDFEVLGLDESFKRYGCTLAAVKKEGNHRNPPKTFSPGL